MRLVLEKLLRSMEKLREEKSRFAKEEVSVPFLGCWKDWALERKKEVHLEADGWLLYIIKMIKII